MIERFAGRYALLRRLGRGGMGEVYLARDLDRRVECALKHLSARSPGSPEQLRREFEVLSHVRHPCVVEVYELDFTPDGAPFFTMEFVPGVPADQALARGDHAALAFVAAQVTHGLEALHGLGIVHGDLKPSNLLVIPASDPRALPLGVRLLDFGLAVLLGRGEGGYRGTPGYAAPEVVEGRPAEVGSDLYGLGALLYATASGQPPFPGSSREEIRSAQAAGPPPATPLEERGVAPGLIRLILRLMASDPRERPRDAREVRRELESLHPAARRPLTERLQAATVVGREREVARFESRLASADGPGRVMLVAGSAGSGKTALLGHLAARAALAGRRVVHLSCAGFGEPGALALTVLRRWAAAGSDASLAGLAAPARALVASEARTFGPEMIDALVAAAVQLGRNATGRLPVVLLDDAERLDPLSWSVVVRLALHPTPPSSEWVLARRGEASLEERSLVAAGAVDLVGLEPLTRDQVDRLVAARLGQPTPAPLLDFLVDRAGGHPGFTVQLLLAAAAAGALRDGDAEMVVDPDALEHLDLPGFEASLLARHRALPAPSRGLVAALAVWGRPMTLESALELARASGSGPDAGALEPLLADGLVMRDADGRLALLPPALDAPLRRGLDPATRRALHRAALALPGLTEAERFRHLRDADEPQAALALSLIHI